MILYFDSNMIINEILKNRIASLRHHIVLMLVINLGIRYAWLIPTHQNSKPLLMSRYTTVTRILFYKYLPISTVPLFKDLILVTFVSAFKP